jgi:hypothetical protein
MASKPMQYQNAPDLIRRKLEGVTNSTVRKLEQSRNAHSPISSSDAGRTITDKYRHQLKDPCPMIRIEEGCSKRIPIMLAMLVKAWSPISTGPNGMTISIFIVCVVPFTIPFTTTTGSVCGLEAARL